MRIAILLVAGLVSMVLALSRGPDEESHEAILRAFRSIDLSYAAMQRDVLQARSGILRNYDFLDTAIDQMQADLQNIDALCAATPLDDSAELRRQLAVMAMSIDRNEMIIERFKSGNALIQNALRIFIGTLSEMQRRSQPGDVNAPFVTAVQQLSQQMWQFQSSKDPELAELVARNLADLRDRPPSPMDDLKKALLNHGFLILKILPVVDEIVGETEAHVSMDGSREAQLEYLQQFGRMNAGLSRGRLLLSVISLGLCAYAIYLAFRLKFYADSLHWRLHVEQSVNDAVTRLALEPERFRILMDEALVRMAGVFGFKTVSLISLDPASRKVQCVFGENASLEAPPPLVQDFLADLRERPASSSDIVLWRHATPSSMLAGLCDMARARRPVAVASLAMPHDELAVMLVADCQSAHWNMRTDAQILRMTTDLLALAIEKHHRLTALEQLDRRLQEMQRLEAVGTLTGGVAHEFNNILMAIMGYAEMAADTASTIGPTRSYINHILTAGGRAKLVVDQMLAFGRMRRNPAVPFDAVEAAIEMLPIIEVCLAPPVMLHVAMPDAPLVIRGSPIEIQQVLVNLCKNAAEAMKGGGHVRLSIDSIQLSALHSLSHGQLSAGRYVRISVTDNGPGIAPGHRQRIFEPFFTTKGGQGGTGLGLSVVHGTVQSLGGAVNVHSILGTGTRFDIYFPQIEAGAVSPKDSQGPASPIGDAELVAIVDAVEVSRSMWEEKVAALGYEPVGFSSVRQLADWYARSRTDPDVVLLVGHGDDEALPHDLARLPRVQICEGGDGLPQRPPFAAGHRVLKMAVGAHGLASAIRAVLEEARAQGPIRRVIVDGGDAGVRQA
jgi:signal transduction histidine kinase